MTNHTTLLGQNKETKARPRIGIFVDVQNIYYTCRQAFGQQFNYRQLWQDIALQGNIVVANAYATHKGDDQQHRFQKALKHIGFTVKLKPYLQRSDGSTKGDWDVGIAVDAMLAANDLDKLVLLSGDGDFDVLLHTIGEHFGVQTEVYAVPELTANSLLQMCHHFQAIDDHLLL